MDLRTLRAAPMIALPTLAAALEIRHPVLIGALLHAGIVPHRTSARSQGRLSIAQAEQIAQMLKRGRLA